MSDSTPNAGDKSSNVAEVIAKLCQDKPGWNKEYFTIEEGVGGVTVEFDPDGFNSEDFNSDKVEGVRNVVLERLRQEGFTTTTRKTRNRTQFRAF